MPTSVPKPTQSDPQVSIADDIITVEDAASLPLSGNAQVYFSDRLGECWSFPQPHRLVDRDRGKHPAIGRKCDRRDDGAVCLDCGDFAPRPDVPELHSAIDAANRERFAVCRESHGGNRSPVASQRGWSGLKRGAPQLHRGIGAPGREKTAIRRERHRVYRLRMTFQQPSRGPRPRIPQTYAAVLVPRDEECTVARKRVRRDLPTARSFNQLRNPVAVRDTSDSILGEGLPRETASTCPSGEKTGVCVGGASSTTFATSLGPPPVIFHKVRPSADVVASSELSGEKRESRCGMSATFSRRPASHSVMRSALATERVINRPLGEKIHCRHIARVTIEYLGFRRIARAPDLRRSIEARSQHTPTVRCIADTENPGIMTPEHADRPLRFDVPETRRVIEATGEQSFAVRRERE